jgi:hypothetical protein
MALPRIPNPSFKPFASGQALIQRKVEAMRSCVDLWRLRARLAVPLKTLRGSLIPPSLYQANSRCA